MSKKFANKLIETVSSCIGTVGYNIKWYIPLSRCSWKQFLNFTILLISWLYIAEAFASGDVTIKKEYWDNGKIRLCKVYDKAENLREAVYYREDGTMEQNEKYDAYNHKIEESYYNEDGTLHENADGWAAMQYRYNGDHLVRESYYDDSGHLQETKWYNELGDLVDKDYYGDKELLPQEEFNPFPTLAGETIRYYDSHGRPEAETSVEYDDWWD